MLQWGRGQVTAEISPGNEKRRSASRLQWGRGQVTAEMHQRKRVAAKDSPASMGPRSGDRGNGSAPRIAGTFSLGFNGAAVR